MFLHGHRSRLILACQLLLTPATTAVWADWFPNGNPIAQITGYQTTPRIAPDGLGGAFVGWSGGSAGHVQRFSPSGDYASGWPATGVMAPAQEFPYGAARWSRVTGDGAGGVYIMETTEYDCYASCNLDARAILIQRLTDRGAVAPGWPSRGAGVSGARTGPHTEPLLTGDGAGGAIVAWENHVQAIGADTTRRWGADGMVLAERADDRSLPQVLGDGRGGAFVFWGEYEGPGRKGRIFAQHLSASGERMWGPDGIPISGTYTLLLGSPAAVSDGSQGVIVAWGGARAGDYDIYAARVTHGGGLPWRQDLLVCRAAGDQTGMRMIATPGGGAIVAWRETRRSPAGALYAQRLSHGGRTEWAPDGVPVCANPVSPGFPVLAWDGSDGAYAAWGDNRPEGELFATRLMADGTPAPAWPATGALLCVWPPSWYGSRYGVQALDITYVGDGRAIVVWDDMRAVPIIQGLDDDLSFATLLAPDGPAAAASLDPPLAPVASPPGMPQRLALAIRGVQPNPALGDFVVRLTVPSAAPARLELLDLSGRSLWAREQSFGPGEHDVPVSAGFRVPPGLYFLRVAQERRVATTRVAIAR
jgi:hypothetical protein